MDDEAKELKPPDASRLHTDNVVSILDGRFRVPLCSDDGSSEARQVRYCAEVVKKLLHVIARYRYCSTMPSEANHESTELI